MSLSIQQPPPELEQAPPPPEPKTLADILIAFRAIDELVEDPNFDPEQLVGALKDKVDAVDYVARMFDGYGERKRAEAAAATDKARKAEAKAQRLRDYVLMQMRANEWTKLPGNLRFCEIRKASTPRLVLARPAPTAKDALDFPDFVALVPQRFEWRQDVIKARLIAEHKAAQAEERAPAEVECARIEFSEYVHFDDVTGVKEKKGKSKGAPKA